MNSNIYKKVAFITGASKGLGRALAIEIAKRGNFHKIIISARDAASLEKVADEIKGFNKYIDITIAPIDLSKFIQINELGAHLQQNFDHIDLFIGNAAQIGELTPIEQTAIEQFQEIMKVNFEANFYLLKALHPLFMRSQDKRAVAAFISSYVASHPTPFFGAYGISKAALEHMAELYNIEQKNISNIKAITIDPGVMATKMRASIFPGEDPKTLQTPDEAATKIMDKIEKELIIK